MDDVRERVTQFFSALPVGQRITLGAVGVGLVMVSVWFFSWVTAPAMTVLASGLDASDLSEVVDQLEASDVPYEIGAGGSAVMVPRDQLYTTRAELASAGVASGEAGEGWEILDDQGIAISDFQQQTNYQRALEGELSRTLTAMEGIDAATVHLVLPEDRLFTEQQEQRTASVLLDTGRDLAADEVESVVFLVASAVEGLETGGVTVADAGGTVLHAPGDSGGTTTGASRQLRETREYEQALASDIQRLLSTATGSAASVVVRATLDFDATQTNTRSYDPDTQVTTSEQTVEEEYQGTGGDGVGTVGVDGGPVEEGGTGSTTDYNRNEVLREYGVSETTTTTTQAPGKVDALSVAIVMDDGSITGASVPPEEEVSELVSAAVGLDAARGDSIAVSRVPFPEAAAEEGVAAEEMDMMALASQIGAVLVLLVVAVALFLMSRRRDKSEPETTALEPAGRGGDGGDGGTISVEQLQRLAAGEQQGERVLVAEARSSDSPFAGARTEPMSPPEVPDDTARREVEEMVDRQPEEIANLLRSWLADAN